MDTEVVFGAFLSCLLSGVVPLVNGEVVAVAAALLVTPSARRPLVLACVAGQMIAKGGVFAAARWCPHRLPERMQRALATAEPFCKRRRSTWWLVFASASVAVPPFYLVTLAAGACRIPPGLFLTAGVLGTLARYAVVVWSATRFTP